jgi:hypothetical protein
MAESLARWAAFVDHIRSSDQIMVVEACLFNNLLESLLMHNVARPEIMRYGCELEKVIEPLNPALIYLTQNDVAQALERNFSNRGPGFTDYVIKLATGTPFAKQRGLQGYAGMVTFWQNFVALTDQLFREFSMDKLMIENSDGAWERYNRQVLTFLSLPLAPEQRVSESEAQDLVGKYRDEKSDRTFTVQYENERLLIDIFLQVKTHLLPRTKRVFCTEGWYFEICFERDESGKIGKLEIGGKDVDYLALVGTVAVKEPPGPVTGMPGQDH